MKYFALLFVIACESHYVTRFDSSATTALPANLASDTITLTEGGIVYGDSRFYDNDSKVEYQESDLEVTSTANTVVKVLRGPNQKSFVFIGVSVGDAVIEIRYRGHLVQKRDVHVDPQS